MPADPGGRRVVAVAGEVLTDLVPATAGGLFEAAPGGSPANVAVGLARLDLPTRMIARLAGDVLGKRLRAHLVENGVDLSSSIAATEPSSLAIVALNDSGAAEYDFRVDGTADWQWREEELVGALHGVSALHAGSLALMLPPGAQVLGRFLREGRETTTISYDPNCRRLLMGHVDDVRARVEHLVELADVVKASEEDIDWLYPGRSPVYVAESWLARGPALVTMTLGPHGAVAVARDAGVVRRPGRPVDVADTVGAGDAFMSGMLAGLHRRDLLGADRREALRAISAAALTDVIDGAILSSSITCTRRGANPPTAAELAEITSAAQA